jgi:hypothetical protein
MKSIIAVITFSFLMNFAAFGQSYITQVKPMGKKEWGYMNSKGEMVIAAKYRKCFPFSNDGLAPIYESKKFFFINTKGEKMPTDVSGYRMIEGSFGIGGLQGFSDGLVAIVKGKKWGYMNTDGKVAIELKYDKATSFNGGYAAVKKGNSFYIINKNGEETKVKIAVKDVKSFTEGLAPFYTNDKKSGFINTDGTVAIEAQFVSVGYFVNGLAWAKTSDKKIGYINETGEWVIKPQFLAAKDFDAESGMARIKKDDGWAYVNKEGEVMNMVTETYGDFSEGLAVGKKNGKVGYFNANGDWVIAADLEAGRAFKNGFAAAKKNGKWGIINTSGDWVIEPKFAGIKDMQLVK